MTKQTIYFILILFLGTLSANAQQQNAKWSVGVYSGITNYKGDLSRNFYDPNDAILNIFDNTDYLSYGISIGKSLSDSWSLRLMASQGEFIANDRGVDWSNELVTDSDNFTRSLNVRTEINDLSILGVWSLANNKILPEKVFLAPYFLVGGGFSTFKSYGDLYTERGDRYYYWNDQTIRDMPQDETNTGNIIQQDGVFETELAPLETEGVDYKNRFLHLSVGAGLKFRLWKRMSLNIESLFRFTNTDYLDDVSGDFLTDYDSPEQAYAANPALRESLNRGNTDDKKDRLHFTSISLHYNFGRMPKPFVAPAILIGDLYETDKFQKTNTLPSSTDTTYQPISVIPIIDLDSFLVLSDNDYMEDIEELDIPEIDMTTDDTLQWAVDLSADSSLVQNELPEGIDTFYRVVTPMDSIYYTDELEIEAGLADRVDTLTRIGDVLFTESNNKWEPLDGEDWESYNDFLLASQLSDTTNLLVNNPADTTQFPMANSGGIIDLTTTTDSLTEVDRIAISNPVIEQPPLTIENTIVDTTEMQIIDNAPQPVTPPTSMIDEKERQVIVTSDPRTDSLYWQVSQLSSNIAKLREEQRSDRNMNDAMVNQRLAVVQAELDSLRTAQARNNNELSEQWRADFQLAMTEIEKQIQETKDPINANITNDNSQAEIDGMRREMESMRNYLMTNNQKTRDRSELEEYKRQLWLYEIQSRNMKENTQERQKLEAEINSLKQSINRQQEMAVNRQPAPTVVPVPVNTQNKEEVTALKSEVANLNQSMAEMRKLLEEQNNQNNDLASNAELLAIKAEISKLSNSVNSNNNNNNTNESAVIDQLKAELAATRKQLADLSNKPAPTPTPAPPTIITNTVVPPSPTAREAIAGREKQLVFFSLGAAKLDAPSMQIIQSVAQLMNQYPEVYAELEGFTDPSGNANANLILSGKRATAVQNFLVQYGIAANRLITIPRGEDPASNASYGRRVAIKLNVR